MPGRKELGGFGTSFEAKQWLALDISGLLGISCSIGVHAYAAATLYFLVISNSVISSLVYYMLYVPCAVLAMVSLFQASTTNPGAVPLGAKPFTTLRRAESGEITAVAQRKRSIRRCHKCDNNFKPARAHHDSVTGRCIVKFDHYCPWVNNAVGALNHKFFCLFLLYTALSCVVSLVLLLIRMVHCGFQHEEALPSEESSSAIDVEPKMSNADIIDGSGGSRRLVQNFVYSECQQFVGSHFVTALSICSLVFLIFTVAMGCEQLEAIETGKGKIARMKQSVGSTGTEYATVTQEFNEMFGGDSTKPSWHWYVPIPVRFPRGMKQVVLGYEFNETCAAAAYQEPCDEEEALGPPPLPPPPEQDGLMRETSLDASVKNRRPNSRANSDEDEGITLVERTKTRII